MTKESGFVFVARDSRFVGVYRANATTGIVAPWSYSEDLGAVRWGQAARCGGHMTALVKRPTDGHILLSRGRQTIDLDESRGSSPRVRLRRTPLFSFLTVRLRDRTFRAWNFTPGRLFAMVDPTWDSIDDEGEDFLIGISRLVQDDDAINRLRSVWPFVHHEGGGVSLHVQ